MQSVLARFFERENIEYYAVLPYSAVRETNHGIMERESFTPRSVIVFLLPYYAGETENISRYAASLDYHLIIREVTSRLIDVLSEHFPEASAKGYGDHSPIDERGAALISGLGMLGKNGLLINEKYGSYVFVGDVVSDIPAELLGEIKISEVRLCSGCGLCLAACPTGILRGEGTDCLSAITQRKGELTDAEAELIRKCNTVWGCDLCQSVCPYNDSPKLTPIEFFRENRILKLTSATLDSLSGADFKRRAFAWRGRQVVKRNLEIIEKSLSE